MDSKSHTMSPSGEDTRTPEEIRAEIDATRAALDRTVTEIEQRLQPQHLLEEAKTAAADRVRRAGESAKDAAVTAAEQAVAFGYRTADRVKQSPGMAIGVAVGVLAGLWVTVRGVQGRRYRRRIRNRLSSLQTPAPPPTATSEIRPQPTRRSWRRKTILGAAAAAIGACAYATRRVRTR